MALPPPYRWIYLHISLYQKKTRGHFTLSNPLLVLVLFFPFSNIEISSDRENICTGWQYRFKKISEYVTYDSCRKLNFSLIKDHQFQKNLWNTGIWWHSPYTSKEVVIYWLYLHLEWMRIFDSFFRAQRAFRLTSGVHGINIIYRRKYL